MKMAQVVAGDRCSSPINPGTGFHRRMRNKHRSTPKGELEKMPMQANNKTNPAREHPELDRRYGAIGISAVAAAVRYQSDGKNPAYAPADSQSYYEREDAAA
jgi:hypothetical protein